MRAPAPPGNFTQNPLLTRTDHLGWIAFEDRAEALLALDQALTELEPLDPRLREVVQCRFCGGLTVEDHQLTLPDRNPEL